MDYTLGDRRKRAEDGLVGRLQLVVDSQTRLVRGIHGVRGLSYFLL